MANRDEPQGFRPKGDVKRANKYQAGGTIYPGDAVKLDANGQVVVVAAGNAVLGVALSKAASGEDCIVSDDPDQLYIVQADEGHIDAQTDINQNYDILATAGSSAYNVSRMELDSSTGAATADLPLKLLGIEQRPDNALGAQVDCIVKINNNQLAGGTGTAGV